MGFSFSPAETNRPNLGECHAAELSLACPLHLDLLSGYDRYYSRLDSLASLSRCKLAHHKESIRGRLIGTWLWRAGCRIRWLAASRFVPTHTVLKLAGAERKLLYMHLSWHTPAETPSCNGVYPFNFSFCILTDTSLQQPQKSHLFFFFFLPSSIEVDCKSRLSRIKKIQIQADRRDDSQFQMLIFPLQLISAVRLIRFSQQKKKRSSCP